MSVFDQFEKRENTVRDEIVAAVVEWVEPSIHFQPQTALLVQHVLMVFELGNIELFLTLRGSKNGLIDFVHEVCTEFYERPDYDVIERVKSLRASPEARKGLKVVETADFENHCYTYTIPDQGGAYTKEEIEKMWKNKAFL